MVTRDDLLKYCRIYRGENDCPYNTSLKMYVWITEREWVREKSHSEHPKGCDVLLTTVGRCDKTPVSLKNKLFALMEHFNEGIVTQDSFADFYKRWYNNKL